MMKHLKENNETYLSHLVFAAKMSIPLLINEKRVLSEDVPQSGSSSGMPSKFKEGTGETKYLTLDEILEQIDNISYYKEVLSDVQKEEYWWEVTQQSLKYAEYMMQKPESLENLPSIQVLDGGLEDGSHRISAIYLLANYLDKNNLFWKEKKIKVVFYNDEDVLEYR